MAAPSIGTLLATKKPRLVYRKGQGWTIEQEYEGSDAQLDALVFNNPLDVQKSGNGPVRTLVASFSASPAGAADPDQIDLLWDFDFNEIEKSIFVFASSSEMASDIKEQIKLLEDGDTTVSQAITDLLFYGATDDDLTILDLYLKGVEGVPWSQPVIRKTLTFDKYSTNTNVSYDNINRVYTTAALIDENPSLEAEPITLTGLWLKKCPRTTAQSNGKYVLTQEWWGIESYEQWLYGDLIE